MKKLLIVGLAFTLLMPMAIQPSIKPILRAYSKLGASIGFMATSAVLCHRANRLVLANNANALPKSTLKAAGLPIFGAIASMGASIGFLVWGLRDDAWYHAPKFECHKVNKKMNPGKK